MINHVKLHTGEYSRAQLRGLGNSINACGDNANFLQSINQYCQTEQSLCGIMGI